MNKLEKILPYLAYGVKIEILNYKSDYVGIQHSEIDGYYYLLDDLHFNYKGGGVRGKSIKEIKIFLRPLSDLVNEISINCKTFIPKDILDEKHCSHWSYNNIKCVNSTMLQNAPYWFVQKLIEWNFDVFGLIEDGLAFPLRNVG